MSSVLVFVAGLVTTGCNSEDTLPREKVSGTVTLAGNPLDEGTISFMPTDPALPGTGASAPISNGSYEVSRDQGLVPGPYRVTVSKIGESSKKSTAKAQPGDGDAPATKELIPSKYNTATTLKADVVKDGKNVFDFPLAAK